MNWIITMGKYSRLGKNTVLVFMGNAGAKLVGLIMLPFYTRWLSVEGYGLTDILSVYVTLLVCIVSCSIGESLFIFPKGADDKQKKEYFSTGIIFLTCMLIITAFVFGLLYYVGIINSISNSFFDNIWFIYGMIVCMLSQQTIQQFTRSLDKMVVYSITGIVITVCTALYAFIFIPRYGVLGYVTSLNLAYLSGALYSFIASGAYKYFQISTFSSDKCREMLKYSIPLVPNGVMWWLVGALNRPIMEANVGLEGIGLFAVANKFPGILTMIFGVFATSWQISILEEYGKDGFEVFYNRVFRFVICFLFILFFVLTMGSELLVRLFTTEEYFESWKYIPVLTLGAVLSSISGMGGTVYAAVKKSKYFFYSSVWGALVAAFTNIILIPVTGILGATLSVVLSFMAMAVSRILYAWKYVKVDGLGKYIVMIVFSFISIASVFLLGKASFYMVNILLLLMIIVLNYDLKKEICKLKTFKR